VLVKKKKKKKPNHFSLGFLYIRKQPLDLGLFHHRKLEYTGKIGTCLAKQQNIRAASPAAWPAA